MGIVVRAILLCADVAEGTWEEGYHGGDAVLESCLCGEGDGVIIERDGIK